MVKYGLLFLEVWIRMLSKSFDLFSELNLSETLLACVCNFYHGNYTRQEENEKFINFMPYLMTVSEYIKIYESHKKNFFFLPLVFHLIINKNYLLLLSTASYLSNKKKFIIFCFLIY